ncbi:MAG: bifunctional riboflavin kinase/FAD synthetase [Pirellulaceae bacterium]
MKLLRSLDHLPTELLRGAVSIGNFDGVHRGHARIVERLIAKAREVNGPAVVFTFDPHPVRLLRPEAAPPPLTWTERKAELLVELGVDSMIAFPTDEALLALEAEEFFRDIVREKLDARAMVEGPNFHFGRGRRGDIASLTDLCRQADIALEIVEPLMCGERYVSSSRVRECVAAGEVRQAADMLTRPYRIRGLVTHGARRGSQIGFPTANIDAVDTLTPADGVYACRAIVDKRTWPAAVNIGPNPTFAENARKIEAHLLDFSGSLYGQPLEVEFLQRLRGVQAFDSVEQLKKQLADDIETTRGVAS